MGAYRVTMVCDRRNCLFAIFLSFVVSLILFLQLNGMEPEHRVIEQVLFSWMQVGNRYISISPFAWIHFLHFLLW